MGFFYTFYKVLYSLNVDLVLYGAVICIASIFLYQKKLSKRSTCETNKNNINQRLFNEVELNQKLEQWQPKSIVPFSNDVIDKNVPIVDKKIGKYVKINNVNCLDFSTHNYLGLIGNKDIEEDAINTIRKYGVGSCGPRAFFGTMDAHLKLEDDTAKFFQLEESICYSYGFCTVSSAITAYCKKKDVVFCMRSVIILKQNNSDEKISFAAQKGLEISKCDVIYFKHNDVNDLYNILGKYTSKIDKNKLKTKKMFLIIEGIYVNTGEICHLPDFLKLCTEFKLRVFLDESISIGVLGKTGRGVTEHFNVNRDEIDMIIGSYETAIGSIGGFCVGSSYVIDHQRLFGSGYCFSASLPPLLANAASNALQILNENPDMFRSLKKICCFFHRKLMEIDCVQVLGHPESPIKYLVPKHQQNVQKVIDYCFENGIAVSGERNYLKSDKNFEKGAKSIRVIAHLDLTNEDILKACLVLRESLS